MALGAGGFAFELGSFLIHTQRAQARQQQQQQQQQQQVLYSAEETLSLSWHSFVQSFSNEGTLLRRRRAVGGSPSPVAVRRLSH